MLNICFNIFTILIKFYGYFYDEGFNFRSLVENMFLKQAFYSLRA